MTKNRWLWMWFDVSNNDALFSGKAEKPHNMADEGRACASFDLTTRGSPDGWMFVWIGAVLDPEDNLLYIYTDPVRFYAAWEIANDH